MGALPENGRRRPWPAVGVVQRRRLRRLVPVERDRVTWSYDPTGVTGTTGCGAAVVTEDTGGATFTCTVNYGGPFYGNSVTVRQGLEPTRR